MGWREMDGRGRHGHHLRGPAHYRWRGGNPAPDPAKRRANARASAARYPERRRARERVKDAIRRGAIPSAKALICADCGAPAAAYDHHRGYGGAVEVEPVCSRCHGARGRARGEHRNVRWRGRPTSGGRLLDGRTWDEFPS